MVMKEILIALANQLRNYPDLSFASEYSYVAEDPYELMEQNRYPFWNIVPGDERREPLEEMSEVEMERHIYPITIQFATRSMRINVAVMGDPENNIIGILDFSDHIYQAIIFDRTLDNVVDGILPGSSVPRDYLKDDSMFIARAEMTVEFYKDIGLL